MSLTEFITNLQDICPFGSIISSESYSEDEDGNLIEIKIEIKEMK